MHTKKPKKIWHIIIGGTIGNLTEWYNFLLYGFLAPIISDLFFPVHDKLLSLTFAFTVFALSFFVRPLGGIIFGFIGDAYGRQRALIISLVMMAIPTLLIGFLPTYASMGIWSPLLLSLLRILQGLSAGGEHTGSAIYLAEYAPPQHRALWVSIVPTTAAVGILASSFCSLLIIESFTPDQLMDWGWRVGYWAGAVLCFISILLRITLPETPYFEKIKKEKTYARYPVSILLKNSQQLKKLLVVITLASSWGILYQILFVWMPTYLTRVQHLSNTVALQINNVFIFTLACLILMVGYFSDYNGRKIILISSCIAFILFSYPLFNLLSSGQLQYIYVAMAVFTLIFSLYLPTAFVSMVEIFNTEVRYTGLSFGFNIGLALLGGTCPLVVTWLIEMTGNSRSPAFYMIFAACMALVAAIPIVDKRGQSI